MLTDAAGTVDGPALLLTISDLAKRKGVSKQAISKRVARLQSEGRLTTHEGARGGKLISMAEYDRVVGEVSDLGRETAAATVKRAAAFVPGANAGPVYTDEQARLAAYKADLAQLDLNERLGKLVEVEKLAEAGARIAEALVRVIEGLVGRADEVAAAVAKDGRTGARDALKVASRDLREALARELVALADVTAGDSKGGFGNDQS